MFCVFTAACGATLSELEAPAEGALRVAIFNVHYIMLNKNPEPGLSATGIGVKSLSTKPLKQ